MYTSINYNSPTKNYRNSQLTNYKNYKNKLKILDETTVDGKIKIELSYTKDQGIYFKELAIKRDNLDNIIEKCRLNNFTLETPSSVNLAHISKLENISTNYSHYEYRNKEVNNFKKQAYNNSFKQKYK